MANKKFADAQSIKDDCEKELAKAVPALNSATEALNTLKQDDIRVVKAMKNPPAGVKLVNIFNFLFEKNVLKVLFYLSSFKNQSILSEQSKFYKCILKVMLSELKID